MSSNGNVITWIISLNLLIKLFDFFSFRKIRKSHKTSQVPTCVCMLCFVCMANIDSSLHKKFNICSLHSDILKSQLILFIWNDHAFTFVNKFMLMCEKYVYKYGCEQSKSEVQGPSAAWRRYSREKIKFFIFSNSVCITLNFIS